MMSFRHVAILDSVSLIIDMGRAGREERPADIRETMQSEQRGFQLTFGAENNSLGSTVLPQTKHGDIFRCA